MYGWNQLRVLGLSALMLCAACDDYPTQAVTRCHPNPEACKDFVAESEAAPIKATPDKAVGEQVYLTRCAACHGNDARGGGHSDRGDFRDAGWQKKWSDSDLENIVTAGRGMKMPGQRLPRFEMASLLAYIRSLAPAPKKKDSTGPY